MNIQQLRVQIVALQDATMDGNKNFRSAYDEGKFDALTAVDTLLDSMQEEPVSESLNDYAKEILSWEDSNEDWDRLVIRKTAKHFTDWQKEQFEKNRLAACDRQTEEEAEREQDFVIGIIENEHRKPTFDDAIKYGMRLQRENMMKDAVECTICASYENPYGGFTQLVDSKTPLVTFWKEVKLIIIKED